MIRNLVGSIYGISTLKIPHFVPQTVCIGATTNYLNVRFSLVQNTTLKKMIEKFDDRWLSRRTYNNFEWERFTNNILYVIRG